MKSKPLWSAVVLMGLLILLGCTESVTPEATYPKVDREARIPGDVSKRGPESDLHPPRLHSAAYEAPVPLPGPVNTAGLEDSPFILPDGETLYFFFTPDAQAPAEEQLLDDVTGIWVARKSDEGWGDVERVWLHEPGEVALEGAVCIQGEEMWFASVRAGYEGVNVFTAERVQGTWRNWQYVGDRLMKEIQIGEVHLQGDQLFFHSERPGGQGGRDIWVTTRTGDTWFDPIPIEAVNTPGMEGFPFVSPAGDELWFTRTYNGTPAIFRSTKVEGAWSAPELVVSQFAGEPTLDGAGNLYFVHHFYENGVMIEADIYVAYRH